MHPFARTQNCGSLIDSLIGPMMKTLITVMVLAAVAMTVGQVRPERLAATEHNSPLPVLFSSQPARVLVRACGNCQSNHTDWPWYSRLAPVSWWIGQHVREGRAKLDFSEWEKYSTWQKRDKLESVCGVVSTGRMPPRSYTAMHPEAKLTEAEKKTVCSWVKQEMGNTR